MRLIGGVGQPSMAECECSSWNWATLSGGFKFLGDVAAAPALAGPRARVYGVDPMRSWTSVSHPSQTIG